MGVPYQLRLGRWLLSYLPRSGLYSISNAVAWRLLAQELARGATLATDIEARCTHHNASIKYTSNNRRTRARRFGKWHASRMQSRIASVIGEVEAGHVEELEQLCFTCTSWGI
jgi:hypothetical protein